MAIHFNWRVSVDGLNETLIELWIAVKNNWSQSFNSAPLGLRWLPRSWSLHKSSFQACRINHPNQPQQPFGRRQVWHGFRVRGETGDRARVVLAALGGRGKESGVGGGPRPRWTFLIPTDKASVSRISRLSRLSGPWVETGLGGVILNFKKAVFLSKTKKKRK